MGAITLPGDRVDTDLVAKLESRRVVDEAGDDPVLEDLARQLRSEVLPGPRPVMVIVVIKISESSPTLFCQVVLLVHFPSRSISYCASSAVGSWLLNWSSSSPNAALDEFEEVSLGILENCGYAGWGDRIR